MPESIDFSALDPFERQIVDPAARTGRELSHLLNAIVAPRAIAWISTLSKSGTANIAPHSYTTVFSTDPPIVGFVSIGQKDTLQNARDTGDFVYNVCRESLLDAVNHTSANFPSDVSEFTSAGLTPVQSDLVQSPRLGESPLSMEAQVEHIMQVADSNNFLVMGRVVRMHIATDVLDGDRINVSRVRPPARLGGSQFSLLGEIVSLKRPIWPDLQKS